MNGQPSRAALHPRLLFHDRLATAIEEAVRTGRRLAVLCCDGAERERLGDLAAGAGGVAPATLECRGLTFVLKEQVGAEAAGPNSNAPASGMGMAVFPRDAGNPESLCRIAAAAARGEARPAMPPGTPQSPGLPRDPLELYYQPQIELRSGRAVGVEALARRPAGAGSGADDPAGAPAGMHDGNGFWTLERAVRDLTSWRALGGPTLQVAINLSIEQAGAAALPGRIAEVLEAGALPPGCLEIELTEHRPCLDHGAASAALDPIRGLGVRLALDDFGTGFASLSLFDRLALDTLKIDRCFVAALSDSGGAADSERLIRDIIGLAHARNLRVVAEGVENEAQLAALRRLGCDLCQGYLFSAPLPGPALGERLAAGGFPARRKPKTP